MSCYLEYFVNQRLIEIGINKPELIRRCGYRNIGGGLQALQATLLGSADYPLIMNNIAEALNITAAEWDPILQRNKEELADQDYKLGLEAAIDDLQRKLRWVRNFNPRLEIQHAKSRPKSISIVAFVGPGHWKYIGLPDKFNRLIKQEQLDCVQEIIRDDYSQKNGICDMFGSITGYRLQRTFTHALDFSVDGDFLEYKQTVPAIYKASLYLKGREIPESVLRGSTD